MFHYQTFPQYNSQSLYASKSREPPGNLLDDTHAGQTSQNSHIFDTTTGCPKLAKLHLTRRPTSKEKILLI